MATELCRHAGKMTFDQRLPTESSRAHQALTAYCGMGPPRSIRAVGQKLGKSGALTARWSARWGWVARAAAYDQKMALIAQEAAERALKAETKRWQARLRAQREEEYQLAEQFLDRARAILNFPLVRSKTERSEDGKTVVTVTEPAGWTLDSAVRLGAMGTKLSRLALGLPLDGSTDAGPPGAQPQVILYLPSNGREWSPPVPEASAQSHSAKPGG
jgi:hypothetical protein